MTTRDEFLEFTVETSAARHRYTTGLMRQCNPVNKAMLTMTRLLQRPKTSPTTKSLPPTSSRQDSMGAHHHDKRLSKRIFIVTYAADEGNERSSERNTVYEEQYRFQYFLFCHDFSLKTERVWSFKTGSKLNPGEAWSIRRRIDAGSHGSQQNTLFDCIRQPALRVMTLAKSG